jgi:hypothetical protein
VRSTFDIEAIRTMDLLYVEHHLFESGTADSKCDGRHGIVILACSWQCHVSTCYWRGAKPSLNHLRILSTTPYAVSVVITRNAGPMLRSILLNLRKDTLIDFSKNWKELRRS